MPARRLRLRANTPTRNPPAGYKDLYLQQDGDIVVREHDGTETPLGGTGEQTIRLLGPFTVAFDTPGIEADRVAVGEGIAQGALILDIFLTGLIPWNTATTAALTLGIVFSDETGNDLATWNVLDPVSSLYWTDRYAGALLTTNESAPGDVFVAAFVDRTGDASPQGQAAFYALIAEPTA